MIGKQQQLLDLRKQYSFTEAQTRAIALQVNEKLLKDPKQKALILENMAVSPRARAAVHIFQAYELYKQNTLISFQVLFDTLKNENLFKPADTVENNIKELRRTKAGFVGIQAEIDKYEHFMQKWVIPEITPFLKGMFDESNARLDESLKLMQQLIDKGQVKSGKTAKSNKRK